MKNLNSKCPICGGTISLLSDVEESELITCPECNNRLVVKKISNGNIVLNEAPKIEEDWGQ